jgi:hypothetical protein
MRHTFAALVCLRLVGLLLTLSSISFLLIVADSERLSSFTINLFKYQELVKSITIISIFVGIFFLFYSSSKIPERSLKLKLLKGTMKMHPALIKETLETWFKENQLFGLKLLSVNVNQDNKIGLELKTSNLEQALISLEDVEYKLKEYMLQTMGIDDPIQVQLYEL